MTEALLLVGDSESNQNLYYRTHFLAGDPFVYVETQGRGTLVVGSMEQGRAEKESTVAVVKSFEDYGYRELIAEHGDRNRAFTEVLLRIIDQQDAPIRVEGRFPVLYADGLRGQGRELIVDPELLITVRRQKSAVELAAIEQAQRATERAVARAIEVLAGSEDFQGSLQYHGIPLTSERLRAEIEQSLMRENLDPGTPIVAGGPGAADPHWLGSGPLKAGEAVVLDVFPRHKNSRYFADMTRTVVKGTPSPVLQAMYQAVLAAHGAALAEIHAGADGKDVHAAVVNALGTADFGGESGPRLTHSTGHGVGLDIHEAPGLGTMSIELLEGDVVTVEPGLYEPEIGGIRLEDMVVVTADGYRNLTDFPKQFEV